MTLYPNGVRPATRPLPALAESRIAAPRNTEARQDSAIQRALTAGVGDFYIDPFATGSDPVIHHAKFDLNADGSAAFSGDLSAVSGTFGTITAGKLQGNNITLNLDATGTQAVLSGSDWLIRANGAIVLGDDVSISNTGSATFSGSLSAASGTFAGTLSAVGGTFGTITAGVLQNASGTRFINLSATGSQAFIQHNNFSLLANGTATFSGDLSAAGGTFSGTVAASSFTSSTATFEGQVEIEDGEGGVRVQVDAQNSGSGRVVLYNSSDDSRGVIQATSTGMSVVGTGGLEIATAGGSLVVGDGGETIGFYGSSGVSKPTVSGSRGGNAALQSLLTALANMGLITDSSS